MSSFREFADEVVAQREPGECLVLLEEVGSTNEYARCLLEAAAAAESGRLPPTVVVSYEQTAGRGRLGRSWTSSAGLGIYMTWVVSVMGGKDPVRILQTLPLLAGVGLCEGVKSYVDADVGLKWPNDLLIGGKKVAGILIETVAMGSSKPQSAIVGIGVNHGHGEEQLPTAAATSLRLAIGNRKLPSLGSFFLRLRSNLSRQLSRAGDLPYAVERYRRLLIHRAGKSMTCRMGDRTVAGSFEGLDERGHLLLKTDTGTVAIAAGEVVETGRAPLE